MSDTYQAPPTTPSAKGVASSAAKLVSHPSLHQLAGVFVSALAIFQGPGIAVAHQALVAILGSSYAAVWRVIESVFNSPAGTSPNP